MNSRQAKTQLLDWMRANSGIQLHRPHLGMSTLDRCPRHLYDSFLQAKRAEDVSEAVHRRCYHGHLVQRNVTDILVGAGIAIPLPPKQNYFREIVASFDARLRGHTDGETPDGWLIEIKSTDEDEFNDLVRRPRLPNAHFVQTQGYMRWGNYTDALVVAVNRASFDFWFLELRRDDQTGGRIEEKAKMILRAIDRREPPKCVCGRCNRLALDRVPALLGGVA